MVLIVIITVKLTFLDNTRFLHALRRRGKYYSGFGVGLFAHILLIVFYIFYPLVDRPLCFRISRGPSIFKGTPTAAITALVGSSGSNGLRARTMEVQRIENRSPMRKCTEHYR